MCVGLDTGYMPRRPQCTCLVVSFMFLLFSHWLMATMESVDTGQAPITLERKITAGGKQIDPVHAYTLRSIISWWSTYNFAGAFVHNHMYEVHPPLVRRVVVARGNSNSDRAYRSDRTYMLAGSYMWLHWCNSNPYVYQVLFWWVVWATINIYNGFVWIINYCLCACSPSRHPLIVNTSYDTTDTLKVYGLDGRNVNLLLSFTHIHSYRCVLSTLWYILVQKYQIQNLSFHFAHCY